MATERVKTTDRDAGAVLRYRIMAFVTGTVLLLGCVVGLPLQYAAHITGPSAVLWTGHGFLFIAYLLAAFDLGIRKRWSLVYLGLVCLAGTVPCMSFVAEHNVMKRERAKLTASAKSLV